MPLLHRDNGHGGGGPDENRNSIADFFDRVTHLSENVAAPAAVKNECGGDDWPWEQPDSPEAAQTPRALVPANCFPPRHPREFASFSELAQPGMLSWNDDLSGNQAINNLMSSFNGLSIAGVASALAGTPPPLTNYDNNAEPPWPPERRNSRSPPDEQHALPRNTYVGVVSERSGTAVLRWSGVLPARAPDFDAGVSPKLFLGGLPRDISENDLIYALKQYQPIRVEWPGREAGGCPRGFAYVTLECERRVRNLLQACRRDRAAWYYKLHSRKVQVIPWAVSDANWVCAGSGGGARLDSARTVFVGALHGMLSAAALAHIMHDLFGGVVYAGIDTDKNKYPIGSGRVTFDNVHSYVRAISAAFIDIQTDKFNKIVQIDPYLEDSMCSVCNLQQGPYFCRAPTCFGYFCRSCWSWQHSSEEHKPMMRSSKLGAGAGSGPAAPAGPRPDLAQALALYGPVYGQGNDGTPSPSSGASGASGSGSGEEVAPRGPAQEMLTSCY